MGVASTHVVGPVTEQGIGMWCWNALLGKHRPQRVPKRVWVEGSRQVRALASACEPLAVKEVVVCSGAFSASRFADRAWSSEP